jgi:uncharacterized protein with gpF-like domain
MDSNVRRSKFLSIEARRNSLEFSQTRAMARMFVEQYKHMVKYLPEGTVNINPEITKRYIKKLYIDVGSVFAKQTYIEVLGQKTTKDFELNYEQWMAAYFDTLALARITGIDETTRKLINGVLKKASEEGLSIDDTEALLRKEYASMSSHRARTIARTEIVSASNAGSLQGAMQVSALVKKVWIATFDSETRDSHAEADWQLRGLDDPFNVGGEQLEYPGDPSGSAENVINCRCAIGYERI